MPLPLANRQLSSVVVNDRLYVLGGITELGIMSDVWELDTNSGTWIQGDGLLRPMRNFSTVALDNAIYALQVEFGSMDVGVAKYSFESEYWADMPPHDVNGVGNQCVAVANDKIYLFGGHGDLDYGSSLKVYEYDPSLDIPL
mgnify:FL=1